jgi:DNA primase
MDSAEEVKSHLDIVDVAGEYLQLKPAGSGSFKTCCPFHQEKTPSFFVNRQRQSWHCFGCDKGGDLISFVMGMEGMDFRDALELLAQKAGITLPSFDGRAAGERKRLHEVNDMAARFFRAHLLQSPGAEHARAYAAGRGIDDLTGDLFRIGYAPNTWDALTKALASKGVTEQEMVRAGLAGQSQRGSGVYDRFRDRLMFAIQDVHGNVAGFTGRLLNPDAKEAKYVNTPETLVYKKSAILYGLDKAKGDVKRKDLCVIVEGNMDALSSHRVGIQNVVASSGTALTAEQLKLIGRFTKNIAIAFDQDAAGGQATLRGLDLARAQDFSIRIITLPEDAGKDPDDAISRDPKVWEHAIADAKEIMEWIFRSAFQNADASNPEEKRAIAKKILPEIKRIADPIVRDHWIKKLAEALGTGEQALRDALANVKSAHANARKAEEQRSEPTAANRLSRERDLAERILCILMLQPSFAEHLPAALAGMLDEDLSAVYNSLVRGYDDGRSYESARQKETDSGAQAAERLPDYLAIRADRDYQNQSRDALASELKANIAAFADERRAAERKRLEEEMRSAELAGDREKIQRLEQRFIDMLE